MRETGTTERSIFFMGAFWEFYRDTVCELVFWEESCHFGRPSGEGSHGKQNVWIL